MVPPIPPRVAVAGVCDVTAVCLKERKEERGKKQTQPAELQSKHVKQQLQPARNEHLFLRRIKRPKVFSLSLSIHPPTHSFICVIMTLDIDSFRPEKGGDPEKVCYNVQCMFKHLINPTIFGRL